LYGDLFKKSLSDLKEEPKLVLPLVFLILSTVVVGILVVLLSGILPEFGKVFATFSSSKGQDIDQALSLFLQNNWKRLIIALLGFLFANFFVGSTFRAMHYIWIKEKTTGKKPVWKGLWKETKRMYWGVVGMRLFTLLIPFVFLAVSLGTGFVVVFLLSKVFIPLAVFFGVLFAILTVGIIILTGLGLSFRYPSLFLKKKAPWQAIRSSFLFFKQNVGHVIVVAVIAIAVSAGVGLIQRVLMIPVTPTIFVSILLYMGLTILIELVFNVVLSVWRDLFYFRAYQKR